MMNDAILAIHVGATLAMVGIIWFVQLVHYPLMARVGPDRFSEYEIEHQRRTTWVVAPLMLAEAATAAYLLFVHPSGYVSLLPAISVGLLGVIWISTFFVQVPQHERLARGYDHGTAVALVRSNWVRTAAWSLRGALVLSLSGIVVG